MEKRNFKEHPLQAEEIMYNFWYVVEDDCIGGHAIATVNKPTSQINPYDGEFEVAHFVFRQVADNMVKLHNSWWDDIVWESYMDNIWHHLYAQLDQ